MMYNLMMIILVKKKVNIFVFEVYMIILYILEFL